MGLGFRVRRNLLVATLYAPLCESVGTYFGRDIALRGPSGKAWNAMFVARNKAVGGAYLTPRKDTYDRFPHGVFAEVHLVHPFRRPTNHAQRLRDLRFAREQQSRLLWNVAYGKVVSKDKLSQKAQSRATVESWLTFDYHKAAGVQRFFPAVLDLPMRCLCEPTPGDRLKWCFDQCSRMVARLGAHDRRGATDFATS